MIEGFSHENLVRLQSCSGDVDISLPDALALVGAPGLDVSRVDDVVIRVGLASSDATLLRTNRSPSPSRSLRQQRKESQTPALMMLAGTR
jgi:hypothetical protein